MRPSIGVTASLTIAISPEMKDRLKAKFEAEGRDLSNGLRWLIHQYLDVQV